jgi:histidinol-phosphate/aromatic aminotransferase/cobyric acid decarboxylase-like protein
VRIDEARKAREELWARLGAVPGLRPLPSEGNFVLVDVSASGLSAERWVEALLAEHVLVRSLSVHHGSRSWVRVTVGTREQNAACAAAFERVVARTNRGARRAFNSLAVGDAE